MKLRPRPGISILLKNPKNALTRLSMNGKALRFSKDERRFFQQNHKSGSDPIVPLNESLLRLGQRGSVPCLPVLLNIVFSYIEESTALLCAPPSIRYGHLFRIPPCSGCYTQEDAGKLRSPNLCICILILCPPPKRLGI